MKVIKRNGELAPFEQNRIFNAIMRAMIYGSGIINEEVARKIASEIKEENKNKASVTISKIEEDVYFKLVENDQLLTAKAYEGYRTVQSFKRQTNTTDDSILGLLHRTNHEVMNENSNKNGVLASTQRDLIAGEVSKDITRRKLLPAHIVQAHDNGILHLHDMDYMMQNIFNCCLVNIGDMLDNGTVINKRRIETPNSFHVACIVMTQIIAQVASGQYGGQSIDIRHLGKYLRKSKERYYELLADTFEGPALEKAVNKLVKKELTSGVQTIQYQINTLMTVQG